LLKIFPRHKSGTSEWNDAVTQEMSNVMQYPSTLKPVIVRIVFLNNNNNPPSDIHEHTDEVASKEDSDDSTLAEPPNIIEEIFGGLRIKEAPVTDAGSIIVHQHQHETIEIRNAFFRIVDRPGSSSGCIYTTIAVNTGSCRQFFVQHKP
jgi:hypothetical protein